MKVPWISLVVTAIIIYIASTRLDLPALVGTFQQMDLVLAGMALLTWFFVLIFKSIKWRLVIHSLNGKVSLLDSIKVLFIGLFVGVATPGRVGDFIRAAYVKPIIGMGRGVMGVLVDRLMDIFTLLLFAGIGIAGLAAAKGIILFSPLKFAGVLFVLVVVVFAAFNRSLARRLWKILQRFAPQWIRDSITQYGKEFYDSIPLLKKNVLSLIGALACGLVSWLLIVTMGYFLMQALGINLPWTAALLVVPILALVELIPAGIAGLGTRELASVLALGVFSVPAEQAVAFSLMYFAFGYIPSFLIGAFFFNRDPIRLKELMVTSKK